jgi:hypothetical protein
LAAVTGGDGRGRDLLRSLELQLSSSQIAEGRERARKLNAEAEAETSARLLQP